MSGKWQATDAIGEDFPTLDAILAVADLGTPLPCGLDLERADWSDTTGDHRWRSLDPGYVPGVTP
jgi:hypothetical protein